MVTVSPFTRKKDTERKEHPNSVKLTVMVENVADHKPNPSLGRDCNVVHYPESIKGEAEAVGIVWIKYKTFRTAK